MRESVVESALKKRIKSLGGEIRKVKFIAVNGAPDRLVYLFGRLIWVELKRPGGPPPTDRQIAEHELLRAHGQAVLVIDSLELIDYYFPLKG